MAQHNPLGEQQVIVVLGTTVRADGRPGARLARRIERAVAAARADPEALLLLTGGAIRGRRAEALVMAETARAAGLPADRLLLEPKARSTLENALFTARLLEAQPGHLRITLVTDRLHGPRARLTFRAVGLPVTPMTAAWGPGDCGLAAWLGGLSYEAAALLWYGLKIALGQPRRAARDG